VDLDASPLKLHRRTMRVEPEMEMAAEFGRDTMPISGRKSEAI
jgi:hypothetical protein